MVDAAGDVDAAAGLLLEPGQNAQERRLAAPRRSNDAQKLARLNIQVDARECLDTATLDPKRLGKAAEANLGRVVSRV